MKTFDDLYGELVGKIHDQDPASATVKAVAAGVHEAGKKVVEEAAEAWMAAEYESAERTAEEIAQLLYRTQVLMITRGLTLADLYARL